METGIRLGNGTTSLRSGPGNVGTRSEFKTGPVTSRGIYNPPHYLYIPRGISLVEITRGIYISLAVFMYPSR